MTRSTVLVVGVFSILLINNSFKTGFAEEQAAPSEIDLLRAIEKARTDAAPFKLCGMIQRDRAGGQRFAVECEGNRYRITTSGRAVVIYDGHQLLCYDGRDSAVVMSREQRTEAHFAFDPRALGITTGLYSDLTLNESVAYRLGRDFTLAAANDPSGKQDPETVTVELTDRFGQRVRFAMQPRSPYRVYRYSKTIPRSDADGGILVRYVTEAEYWPDAATSWLPKRLVMYHQPNGDVSQRAAETTVEFNEPEFVSKFDRQTWTIEGLSMPVGQPLTDLRIKQRIGYWDGSKLLAP